MMRWVITWSVGVREFEHNTDLYGVDQRYRFIGDVWYGYRLQGATPTVAPGVGGVCVDGLLGVG